METEEITITVPKGYGEMATNYVIEAIRIAVKRDENKKREEEIKSVVESKLSVISAVNKK